LMLGNHVLDRSYSFACLVIDRRSTVEITPHGTYNLFSQRKRKVLEDS